MDNMNNSKWCAPGSRCLWTPPSPWSTDRYDLRFKILSLAWRKSGFWVLENSSLMRDGFLFGFATYFLLLFLKWGKLSKNKNPLMTPVRKKRTAKLDLWVQGLGYLLGRYLMRGSTRPEIQSLLVHWIHYRIWVEDQSIPPPPRVTWMIRLMQF